MLMTREKQRIIGRVEDRDQSFSIPWHIHPLHYAGLALLSLTAAVVVVATCCFFWRVCNQNAHFPEKRSQKNKKKLEGRAAGRDGDGGGGQQGGANRHIDRLNGVVGFE